MQHSLLTCRRWWGRWWWRGCWRRLWRDCSTWQRLCARQRT